MLGWALLLVTNVGTYIEWHYINHFSTNKCKHFEGTGHTLWNFLVPSNALEGFPSVPCERGWFLLRKTGFLINICHKKASAIDESEESDESNNGVFLLFLLYWLTCGACWLSGGVSPFALAPRLLEGVCMFWMILILTERSGRFVTIVFTSYEDGASQRHWRRWQTELCMGRTNHRRMKKKWMGKCLDMVVMRSVSCLLFNPVGQLVSHQSVLFCLLVHHLNLLILPLLFLSE